MDSLSTGAEAGFFKVGRRGGRGWYLGVAESMEHAPKMGQFENWNPTENSYTRNDSNATK